MGQDAKQVPAQAEAVKTETVKLTAEQKEAQKVATAKAKAEAKAAEKANKKPGVIATIALAISESKTGITQAGILARLKTDFPDKPEAGMLKTVKAQTGGKTQPTRMETERAIKFVITVDETTKEKSFKLA